MPNAVIAGYARSPFHLAGKGDLARVRPERSLLEGAARGALASLGLPPMPDS